MKEPIIKCGMALYLMLVVLFGLPYVAQANENEQEWPSADWAAPSKDGSKLAFVVSEPIKGSTIWIANRDGSNPKMLIDWSGSIQTEPDWAADGQSIAFSSNQGSKYFNIWTIHVDGTNPAQLTSDVGNNRQPRYSPDGSRILFTSNRTGKRELWHMASDGSDQKAIGLQSLLVGDPSWSQDGKSVVYTGCIDPPPGSALTDGMCNVYLISLDASNAKQVTLGSFLDSSPDWGNSDIVFTSLLRDGGGLWLIDANGNNLRQITKNSLDLNPKWDIFSNTVIFTRGNEIWSSDLHGNEIQLTHIVHINKPPIANAGIDQTVIVFTPVTLNGITSTDSDNNPLKFSWIQVGGPPISLSDAAAPTPNFRPSLPGSYAFNLTVNDGYVDSAADMVTIVVKDTPLLLLGPNGGENLTVGDKINVQWYSSGIDHKKKLKLKWSKNGGAKWKPLKTVKNTGNIVWKPRKNQVTEQGRLMICLPKTKKSPLVCDASDTIFAVKAK